MPTRVRDTQSFGKRHEFIAIAKLLEIGYDVYLTLVDDRQIDCIIRDDHGAEPTYCDVQIKARSGEAQRVSWARWPNVKIANPRKNFLFVFYSEPLKEYWVIPSVFLAQNSPHAKSGPKQEYYTITLAKWSSGGKPEYVEAFKPYRDAFHLLNPSLPASQASKRR